MLYNIFLWLIYFIHTHLYLLGLLRWLNGKESSCQTGDMGSIPGLKDLLEKDMATHSSILAWETLWTEEPGGLQSMGVTKESDTTLWLHTHSLCLLSPTPILPLLLLHGSCTYLHSHQHIFNTCYFLSLDNSYIILF